MNSRRYTTLNYGRKREKLLGNFLGELGHKFHNPGKYTEKNTTIKLGKKALDGIPGKLVEMAGLGEISRNLREKSQKVL